MTASAAVAPATRETPRFQRRPLFTRLALHGRISLILIVLFVLAAVLGPLLPGVDPYTSSPANRFLPIGTPGHPLGTDDVGRDMLARLLIAIRASLVESIVPVVLSLVLGTAIALLAGLRGRIVNGVVMRVLDIAFAFPAVLLALLLAASIGPGVATTIIALTVVWIPPTARIAETEVIRVRNADFVTVARTSGASGLSVAFHQVTPAIVPGVLAYSTSLVGGSIAIAGGLGYLGLGPASPDVDLGSLIEEMQSAIYNDPMLALLPALVTLVLAVLFPIFGDALGKALVGRRA